MKLAVRTVACSSGLRISTGRRGVEQRRWPRGQEGLGINNGEEFAAAQETHLQRISVNFRRGHGSDRGKRLRVKPGLGAELWWGSAGAVARQGGVAAAL